MAKKGSSLSSTKPWVKTIYLIILILAMLVSVFPLIYMVVLSFMNTTSMRLTLERVFTASYTLKNYVKLFKQVDFLAFFRNSAITTVYAVVVNCVFCSMAAYGFAKKRFPGKNGIFMGFLATMMIPGQVTLIPTFLILKKLGMLNTYSAVALTSCGAFGVLLIHQFMEKLPNDLLEAADIDGCSEFGKFTKIVVPLIKPCIISLAIFTFISVWGSLVLPLIVNTKEEMTTLMVAIANMKSDKNLTDYGFQMAAATLSFAPPFILYLFLQKQFVEGIAISGMKM